MDLDLITIFAFILAISTLAFAMAHIFHRRVVGHEERKLELLARTEEAKAAQIASDKGGYRKLEDRVRVLERIAIDRGSDLAREIEDLRRHDEGDLVQ